MTVAAQLSLGPDKFTCFGDFDNGVDQMAQSVDGRESLACPPDAKIINSPQAPITDVAPDTGSQFINLVIAQVSERQNDGHADYK